MIVTLFEENIFPLPKRGKPKCEKWSKEEKEILKEEEYIPSKKDQKSLLKKKRVQTVSYLENTLYLKVQVICMKIWIAQNVQKEIKFRWIWLKILTPDYQLL